MVETGLVWTWDKWEFCESLRYTAVQAHSMMYIAIAGHSRYPYPEHISSLVKMLPAGTTVVVGGKTGVSRWAKDAADVRGLPVIIIERYGRLATLRRHKAVTDIADKLFLFVSSSSQTEGEYLSHPALLVERRMKQCDWISPARFDDGILSIPPRMFS